MATISCSRADIVPKECQRIGAKSGNSSLFLLSSNSAASRFSVLVRSNTCWNRWRGKFEGVVGGGVAVLIGGGLAMLGTPLIPCGGIPVSGFLRVKSPSLFLSVSFNLNQASSSKQHFHLSGAGDARCLPTGVLRPRWRTSFRSCRDVCAPAVHCRSTNSHTSTYPLLDDERRQAHPTNSLCPKNDCCHYKCSHYNCCSSLHTDHFPHPLLHYFPTRLDDFACVFVDLVARILFDLSRVCAYLACFFLDHISCLLWDHIPSFVFDLACGPTDALQSLPPYNHHYY